MSSLFIQVEGTDGSGKTLQTTLLAERLKEDGHSVQEISFPQYGSPSAKMIEQYLNGELGSVDEISAKQASILYAIDRWAASKKITSWIAEGAIVIANRYVASNMGHQGGKIRDEKEREAFFDWEHELEYSLFGIPKPDITLFLHVTPEISQKLVDKKEARDYLNGKTRDIHEDDLMHLRHAEEAYLHLVNKFDDFHHITCVKENAMLSPEKIHTQIYKHVSQFIAK